MIKMKTKSEPDFTFRCPILASNLKILGNEFVPKTQRNVLYCDVCEKRVFPFGSAAEAERVTLELMVEGKEELPRCVLITTLPVVMALNAVSEENQTRQARNKKISAQKGDGGATRTRNDGIESYTTEVFNVAIVTSEPEYPDAFDGVAEKVLSYLVHGFAGFQHQSEDQHFTFEGFRQVKGYFDMKALRRDAAKQEDEDAKIAPTMFLSREVACLDYRLDRIIARIIRIPPAPKELFTVSSPDESLEAKQIFERAWKTHPCHDDGPLGRNNMPTVNGWNYIVLCTESDAKWFEKHVLPKRTPSGAIMAAGRVFNVPRNLPPSASSSSMDDQQQQQQSAGPALDY
jgi:hypothetical protein